VICGPREAKEGTKGEQRSKRRDSTFAGKKNQCKEKEEQKRKRTPEGETRPL
jgi:hypothetical protein